MKSWNDMGFQLETTGDGSPSLRLLTGTPESGESMHHSGGAAAETQAIYGTLVRDVYARLPAPAFLSLGVGLGYNEILIATESLNTGRPFRLLSYESVQDLTDSFTAWIAGSGLAAEVRATYDEIARRMAPEFSAKQIREVLQKAREENRWNLNGALGERSLPTEPCDGILYDAFSSKTSPELWSQDFLERFLAKGASAQAKLATYACTGNLKRALKAQGFTVTIKPGFQGKRDSTWAERP